jgi:poly(3-hydroxybutyrate) depolymerase
MLGAVIRCALVVVVVMAAALESLAGAARADVLPRLPGLALKADEVSVSGLSSGAYMAGQFGVAYSASLSGAAVLAGGPYGCSRGSVSTAMFSCSCPAEKNFLLDLMQSFPGLACTAFSPEVYGVFSERAVKGNRGAIDDTANLGRHRVYLLSGGQDHVVDRKLVTAAEQLYRHLGVPEAQIRREDLPDAGHAFPSLQATAACGVTASPFINQCQVDTAGELLKWLHPDLASVTPVAADEGALYQFSQRGYAGSGFTGLDSTGWVYVPKACKDAGTGCRLHVAFHGCEQGQSFKTAGQGVFGLQFVQGAGYNRWAEAGRIVVLYPQVKPSTQGSFFEPYRFNPKGCWDFWGYTEKYAASNATAPNFAKRSAPQMKAVKAMIDDLLKTP